MRLQWTGLALIAALAGTIRLGLADTAQIPLSEIAQRLQSCLNGINVRVNNYDAAGTSSHFKPNDSTIQLSACLGGTLVRVNIPEVTQQISMPMMGDSGVHVYVNDVVLGNVNVRPSAAGLTVLLRLEDRHGGVVGKAHCFGPACSAVAGGVIDLHASSAQLQIDVIPEVFGKDVSYGKAHSTLRSNFSVSGLAAPFDSLVNAVIPQFQNAIAASLESRVASVLMQTEVRAHAAAWLRVTLNQHEVKDVQSVRVVGDQLVIEHGTPVAACPAGQSPCSGQCIPTATDPRHCGACNVACAAGQVCVSGSCVTARCPAGQSLCNGRCLATSADPHHCGACNNTCAAEQACVNGACQPLRCPAGQTLCEGHCIRTDTDPRHCGGCNSVCAAGQPCAAGACQTPRCPAGQSFCGGRCISTSADFHNCGGCNKTCATGQACTGGICQTPRCPAGQALCDGHCMPVNIDPRHCGRCNNACRPGQVCANGLCR
jgi:hypothetical protein